MAYNHRHPSIPIPGCYCPLCYPQLPLSKFTPTESAPEDDMKVRSAAESARLARASTDAERHFALTGALARLSITGIVVGSVLFAAAMTLAILGNVLHINTAVAVWWMGFSGPTLILIAGICVSESFGRRRKALSRLRDVQVEKDTYEEANDLVEKESQEESGDRAPYVWRPMDEAPMDGTLIRAIFPSTASIDVIAWRLNKFTPREDFQMDAGWHYSYNGDSIKEQPAFWCPFEGHPKKVS